MAIPSDRFAEISAFVRTAEARSFTVAADRLGLSRSAIGKSVARLERRLGVRLLHRTTRSVALTDDGRAFHERCVRLLADLDEAETMMAGRRAAPRGRLRLDLPATFGRLHVMPLVHRFLQRWPEVEVAASLTDRFSDLIEDGIDLAIRIGGDEDSRLVARHLAPHRMVTCAAPAYLATRPAPETPGDLARHACLTFGHGGRPVDWRFTEGGALRRLPVSGRLCAGNVEALRDAAVAGFGIAQLDSFVAGPDLQAGRLVPLLAAHEAAGPPIRAVYPTARQLPLRVRAFIDLLAEAWSPVPPWDRMPA